jgi:hypothetical protein
MVPGRNSKFHRAFLLPEPSAHFPWALGFCQLALIDWLVDLTPWLGFIFLAFKLAER